LKNFLEHLNIKIIRNEGDNQLLCECPWCGKNKLYVDKTTGLWDCKRGCDHGNPYQLVEKCTDMDSKAIMALLKEYGLSSADHQTVTPKRTGKPRLKMSECEPLKGDEFEKFCEIKGISKDAFTKVAGAPWRHKEKSWALIPGYNPSAPDAACAIMRVHLEGKLIPVGKDGNEEKYPLVSDSTHGLIGVPWLLKKKTKEIYFVEGWRDCMAMVEAGLYATASTGGASTWKNEWLPLFERKIVYIIMDCDSPGNGGPQTNKKTGKMIQLEGQANRSARRIYQVAKKVKIIRLPFEHREDHGKDLYDFMHGSPDALDELLDLVESTPDYEPPPTEAIVLRNDDPDTVAYAFEENSPVKHRYQCFDGWSIYHKNQYQKVASEDEIAFHLRNFIVRCKVKRKVQNSSGTYITIQGNPDKKMKTTYYIKNVLSWLDSGDVHLFPRQKAPCSLNGELDPDNIIPVQNGLLDVTDRKNPILRPHTPDFYTLNYLPFPYDPGRKAPTWLRVLGEYFINEDSSPDTIAQDVIHSWIKRYLLRDTSLQKILCILGKRRSGKGTIGRTIQALIGPNNVTAVTVTGLTKNFGLQPLLNKQLGILWDASLASRNADTMKAVEILKNISGEDGFNVDIKGKPQLDIPKLRLNLLVLANEMLDLRDASGALAGRWTFLETSKSFYGCEDPTIEPKIKEELPGILNLALRAPGALIEHPNSEGMKLESAELSSPYIAFINEWCVRDPDRWVPSKILWAYYCEWATKSKLHEPGCKKFSMKFWAACDGISKSRPRPDRSTFRALREEYGLDQHGDFVGPDLGLTDRPHSFKGIDLREDIKDMWRVRNNG